MENIISDEKAVGEWNTASKPSKSKKDAIKNKQTYLSDRGGHGGRGSLVGRGRGMRGDGRGGRETGRGLNPNPNQGRGYSISKQQHSQQETTIQQSVPSNGSSGWIGGITLAEKLKQAEIQKVSPSLDSVNLVLSPTPDGPLPLSSAAEKTEKIVVEGLIIVEEKESVKEILNEVIDLSILEEVEDEIQVQVPIKVIISLYLITDYDIPINEQKKTYV